MQENYKNKKKLQKIVTITLIIAFIGIMLTILFNQNIINTLQNRIQENSYASNLETQTSCKVIEEKDNTLYVLLTMENQKGIEKITTPDGTIYCDGKKKVSIDRELEEGTNYSIRLKLQGETTEELHTYVATTKPKMKVIDYDTLGDGTTRTVEINYPNIANITNYYSLDNGVTWQVYTEPIQVEDTNKENVLAKIEWNEGKTINKPVNYRDCIDTIIFGEVTWSNGKANIEISSVNKENIEYQINGTDGTWQKGYTLTNLNHNDIIYARVNDGTYIMDEKNTTIQDITAPSKVKITLDKVKYNYVTITVEAIDNETGIKDYTYVLEESADNKLELANITDTTKKITDVTENTTYNIYVIAYDNVGNAKKSNVETVTIPEYIAPTIASPATGGHTGKQIQFDWEELNELAKAISNNYETGENQINNNVSEITVTIDGKTDTLGVGDYTYINGKKVRILGFNHDELVDKTIYKNSDGAENTYAGISFEYVNIIEKNIMNSSATNSGGWANCSLRNRLNNVILNNLENKNYIKQVKKKYIKVYNDANSVTICNDYLWLLCCSEIWNNGLKSGWYGYAITKEGEQYKYYKNKAGSCTNSNSNLIKDSSRWWLRSTGQYNSGAGGWKVFSAVNADGAAGHSYANGEGGNGPQGVSPGFCI